MDHPPEHPVADPAGKNKAPMGPATPTLKLGGFTITGPPAVLAILFLLAAIVWLVVASRPSLGMLLSGGIWIGFMVFWSVTAQRGGGAKTEESRPSRAAHQNLTTVGLLLLFLPVPGLRWHLLPQTRWILPVGLGLEALAVLLHIWARRHLGKNWSSPVTIKPGHQLVRSGPYRLVRHPIYTALVCLAAGTAMVSGELHSLLGWVLFTFAYVRKLRLEERVLAETFAGEWGAYRKSSWALIPFVF